MELMMERRAVLGSVALLAAAGRVSAQEKPDEKGTYCRPRPAWEKPEVGAVDQAPLDNELEKYPRCVICNMDRRKFHQTRHLLHFGDGSAQGTCSVNCVSESMLRERRRGFRAIYAPDFAAAAEPKPMVEASSATYLMGSDLPRVMSKVGKVSFATREAALQAKLDHGGELGSFATAISASMEEAAASLVQRYGKELESSDLERLRQKRKGAD